MKISIRPPSSRPPAGDTPEEQFEFLLEEQFVRYEIEPRDHLDEGVLPCLRPFQALWFTAQSTLDAGEPTNPCENVEVPWWVIKAIATGYQNYYDGAPFGRAFGLTREGKGERPAISDDQKDQRDRGLANSVYELIENSNPMIPVYEAIQSISEKENVGEETVRKAYQKHNTWLLPGVEEV